MNKYFLILPVLLLGGCESCIQRATTVKALNGAIVQQSNLAYEGGLIEIDVYEEVDQYTDEANLLTNEALPVCLSDESKGKAILRQARSYLLKSELLMRGEDE